ncbi:methyltransferase FGSG_00040 [Magnolia sinica]|uniref:methyltransferase FGSG_00040 n=1 Tax=Magnolia sinica TaxID=86752 RepID=UPI0026584D18|nr:methyltransferase FGSG_00040 [Magnolia sinica]
MEGINEEMQHLRFKASELLLREEWNDSINAYSQFISLCHQHLSDSDTLKGESGAADQTSKLTKSLCLAFSNRAEAQYRLRDFSGALVDCDRALEIDSTHCKSLICKGRILLDLDRYSKSLDCFRRALELQISGGCENLHGFLDRCKKLEFQSRTGAFDLSDWVLNGFHGKSPELAEYVGPVQIKRSENCGRGLFATKDLEAGTLLIMTKPVAIGRAILPEPGDDSGDCARMVMWKDFVNKILDAAKRCRKTLQLIYALSTGEDEEGLEVPDLNLFRPETEESCFSEEKPDMGRILKILDVNSLTEDGTCAKTLGKKSGFYGVGLWILASFVNHSCNPNARRLHIGDHMAIHASRDVKAGEEITFAYFDVLEPLKKRRELSKTWGFYCKCKRCRFEKEISYSEELREIEMGLENESEMGEIVVRLEERMRRWMVKGKEKGFLRASFWEAFSGVLKSERLMRRWGRRVPAAEMVAESVAEAVGGDERVVKVVVDTWKKGGVVVDMERAMRLGRGVYGKMMRKKAIRALLELGICEQSY